MTKTLISALILALAFPVQSFATSSPQVIPNDALQLGKSAAGDKTIILNKGAGAANPKLKWNNSKAKIQFSNDGSNFKDLGSGNGSGTGGINILADLNPDFEAQLANWTASQPGTLTHSTSSSVIYNGSGSAIFTPTATGQTVTSSTVAIPNGLLGTNCLASMYFKGGDQNLSLEVTDGTNVLASVALRPASYFQRADATFICPASGNLNWRLKNTGASVAAAVTFDDVHLGGNSLLTQVSQASLWGAVKISGCSTNWTNSTSGTWSNFGTVTGCSYTARGNASAPATNIPGLTFASLPPGEYLVVGAGVPYATITSGNAAKFRFSDGTNTSAQQWVWSGLTGSYNVSGQTITGSFTITTPQSNSTIQIQSNPDVGTTAGISSAGMEIMVYRYPLNSELAQSMGQIAASWGASASMYGTNTQTFGAGPEADLTGGSRALTVTAAQNLTCSADSVKLGINCSIPRTGVYEFCYGGFATNTASNRIDISPHNDAGGKLASHQSIGVSAGTYGAFGQCVQVTINTIGNFGFSLRAGAQSAGTTTVNISSLSVKQLTFNTPTPVHVGSVTSNSAGAERIERAHVGTICSSSPCTMDTNSAGISGITRGSAGIYTINFSPPFSNIPSCFITPGGAIDSFPISGSLSSSSWQFSIYGRSSGSTVDNRFTVVCMGPR